MIADDYKFQELPVKDETPVFLFLLFNVITNFNVIIYLKIPDLINIPWIYLSFYSILEITYELIGKNHNDIISPNI